jgi:amino acid transporter
MIYLVFALIFIAYFYFGYKKDFKRDSSNFKKTIFGILGKVLIGIIMVFIFFELEKTIRRAVLSYYEDKLGMSKELFDKSLLDGTILEKMVLLNGKVDTTMLIFNILFFVFAYLIIYQFNKFIKKRYILNSQKD